MRDNFLISYEYKGKNFTEFGTFQRLNTIKSFAKNVKSEYIG